MLVSKAKLVQTLRTLNHFDVKCSPYIGMQWGDAFPLFHRSSANGFIQSEGFSRNADTHVIWLDHFLKTLETSVSDEVEITIGATGVLRLVGSAAGGSDIMHVHTSRENVVWSEVHTLGDVTADIDPEAFRGIATIPFLGEVQPVLHRDRLMLMNNHAVVFRNNVKVGASGYPYPRETFLKLVANTQPTRIFKTQVGYWCSAANGLVSHIGGHRTGLVMFELFDVGAVKAAEFPAQRLLSSLRNGIAMAAPEAFIFVDPVEGIHFQTESGVPNVHTIEDVAPGWDAFAINPPTARTIYDALAQDDAPEIHLEVVNMPAATPMLRLRRGQWEANFSFFNGKS